MIAIRRDRRDRVRAPVPRPRRRHARIVHDIAYIAGRGPAAAPRPLPRAPAIRQYGVRRTRGQCHGDRNLVSCPPVEGCASVRGAGQQTGLAYPATTSLRHRAVTGCSTPSEAENAPAAKTKRPTTTAIKGGTRIHATGCLSPSPAPPAGNRLCWLVPVHFKIRRVRRVIRDFARIVRRYGAAPRAKALR